MTTESHRELGQHWLDNAIDWYSQIEDSDPWEKTTASALIAGAFFLAARDDDLAGEERHQSEKFEAALDFDSRCLSWDDNTRCLLWAGHDGEHRHPAVRELDEDNPDTLVGDAGLVDDADTIARPLSFGGILDTPRTDFYGTPGPWSAA